MAVRFPTDRRQFRTTALLTSLAAAAALLAGCSTSRSISTAPTTAARITATTGASTTVSIPPRQVTLPEDGCVLLVSSDVALILGAGFSTVPRTAIHSGSLTTIGCEWRLGTSSVAVQVTKSAASDAYQLALAAMRGAKPLTGLGRVAVESDSLTGQFKRVQVLAGDRDVAVLVAAQVFGPLTVSQVEVATQAVLSRL